MVHFGKRLLECQYEPWKEHYIDYNKLKRLLEEPLASLSATATTTSTLQQTERTIIEDDFRQILDSNIEDAVLFSLQEQGKLASKLALLKHDKRQCAVDVQRTLSSVAGASAASSASVSANSADVRGQIRTLVQSCRDIGERLVQLIRFTELNLTGIRKILKKHDRIFSGNKLTDQYLAENYWDHTKDNPLKQLLHDEGVGALVSSLQESFAELNALEEAMNNGYCNNATPDNITPPRRNLTAPDLAVTSIEDEWKQAMEQTAEFSQKPRIPTSSNLLDYFRTHNRLDDYNNRLFPSEPVLFRIDAARRRLHETSSFVKLLAAPAMFERVSSSEEIIIIDELATTTIRPSRVSNFLNLLSTFLFLTNYYIAAPTSGAYAAKLNGSEALAGLVIGMTPTAALAGTLLYSYWTSYSYKAALVFAALSAIIGNILYALALPYKSLTFVLVGRLLIGFGSCRSINRRYIADSYSRDERTAASAAFVTAGSLGMAVGPAIAAVLNLSPSGDVWWSVENAPGWVMCAAWVIYLVFLVSHFHDPPKHDLGLAGVQRDVELAGEKKPLLSTAGGKLYAPVATEEVLPLWCNIPVMATLIICFLLKMTLECCLSSAATVTSFFFDWNASQTGVYLALLGLLMFPANLLVAFFSKRHDDRELIMATLFMMMSGVWGVINYGGNENYTALQYIVFSVVIFVSTNALEGPNMSLLSKTIPHSWSRGFLNVGLLATEAGTLGRTMGDLVITWFGLGGIESLLNDTFVCLGMVITVTVLATYKVLPYLEPRDRDD